MATCLRKNCSLGLPCALSYTAVSLCNYFFRFWFSGQDMRLDCISSGSLLMFQLNIKEMKPN